MTEPTLPYTHDSFRGLKHFARHMLRDGRLTLAPLRDQIWTTVGHPDLDGQPIMTSILFRSGCWQVELLMMHPGTKSPVHRHNFCESADVLLNGGLTGTVNDGPAKTVPRGDNLALNIMSLPLGAWHGGNFDKGVVCLSFQRWIGREPTFIAEDWEVLHAD